MTTMCLTTLLAVGRGGAATLTAASNAHSAAPAAHVAEKRR
jgi:hypothetical protein